MSRLHTGLGIAVLAVAACFSASSGGGADACVPGECGPCEGSLSDALSLALRGASLR